MDTDGNIVVGVESPPEGCRGPSDHDAPEAGWFFWGASFVFAGFVSAQLLILLMSKFAGLREWPEPSKMACVSLTPALFMALGVLLSSALFRGEGTFFSGACGFRKWRFYYPFEGAAMELALFLPFLAVGAASFFTVRFLRSHLPDSTARFLQPQAPLQTVLMDVGWTGFAIVAVVAVFVAPVVEEVAFRRVVYGFARSFLGPFGAVVLTSAVFAGFHMSLVTFPVLFLLGVGLQLLANYHDSVYPAVFYHAAHNALAMFILAIIKFLHIVPQF